MFIMKSKQLTGYLFSALMLTCFQQGTAQTTYNGAVAKPQCQMKDQMGMAPKCDTQGYMDVWADFLWWSANFGIGPGTSTELTGLTPGLLNTATDVDLEIKRPGSKWDPGVRVGLGWNTGYDNWDVQGYWTYFYNSRHRHEDALEVEIDDEVGVGLTEGRAKLRMRYNAADAELGKAYYVSRHFYIRPFTGIHAIWLSQDDDESLLSEGDYLGVTAGTREVAFHSDIDCWGIGPRIGFNSNWGNFRGLSLLANVSGSLMYGYSIYKSKWEFETAGSEVVVRLRDNDHSQMIPTLQTQWGIAYGFCFGKGYNQFRISAAWESNFLWETSNFLQNHRPISMQGLTVDLRFDF